MKLKSLILTAVVSVGFLLSPSLWAASLYTLQADTNPLNTGTVSLYQSGKGNAEHQGNDIVLNPGQNELFGNVVDLRGSVSGFVANSAGSFTIDENVWDSWDSIFLGLKQGNSYAIFELTNMIVSGTWSTTCGKKPCTDLSHYLAFGGDARVITPPNAVPVPAAVWLFGSAIAGLFGTSRRKQAA